MARRRVVADASQEVDSVDAAKPTGPRGPVEEVGGYKSPMPAGCRLAVGGESACAECGAALTVSARGVFHPCGHSQVPAGVVWSKGEGGAYAATDTAGEGAKVAAGESMKVRPAVDATITGQEVTVVWGKELFSPKQFHTFEVGPFTASTRVLPGETFEDAAERAMVSLRRFAESERERKRASYMTMVK